MKSRVRGLEANSFKGTGPEIEKGYGRRLPEVLREGDLLRNCLEVKSHWVVPKFCLFVLLHIVFRACSVGKPNYSSGQTGVKTCVGPWLLPHTLVSFALPSAAPHTLGQVSGWGFVSAVPCVVSAFSAGAPGSCR